MATNETEIMDTMNIPTSKREALGAILKGEIQRVGGIITAEQLLDIAQPDGHPLHQYFTWDDGDAGRLWRLYEARVILRVAVEYLPSNNTELTRVTVHLTSDNKGYRLLTDVLSDSDLRLQLLADASNDVEVFKRKYRKLSELSPAINKLGKAVDRLKKRH